MLEQLLEEINELKKYKERYELAERDKERMSEMLYNCMVKEYESMTKEERIEKYKKEYCANCIYRGYGCTLPDNIMQPIRSKDAYIPGVVYCKKFKLAIKL